MHICVYKIEKDVLRDTETFNFVSILKKTTTTATTTTKCAILFIDWQFAFYFISFFNLNAINFILYIRAALVPPFAGVASTAAAMHGRP